MSALAQDLALVLVDGVDDADRVGRVDRALADALDALARTVDALGPSDLVDAVATAATQLLVALRRGDLDRSACRIAAPTLLDRMAAALGPQPELAPLVALLDALSTVPDDPDQQVPALVPDPDPARAVEVALAELLEDPGRRGDFLDVLAGATVHVPVLHAEVTEHQLALRFLPLVLRDGVAACAFTDPWRFAAAASPAHADVAVLALTGDELAELWPSWHALALNPGHVLGTVVTAPELASLAQRRARLG